MAYEYLQQYSNISSISSLSERLVVGLKPSEQQLAENVCVCVDVQYMCYKNVEIRSLRSRNMYLSYVSIGGTYRYGVSDVLDGYYYIVLLYQTIIERAVQSDDTHRHFLRAANVAGPGSQTRHSITSCSYNSSVQ